MVIRKRTDDSTLALEALAGKAHSFEVLVERYYKVLFSGSIRMLGNEEDALDVVQNSFMKAYEKLYTYKPEHKFYSWIYRIMINESLNQMGRRKSQESLDVRMVAHGPDPEKECAQSELSQAVSAALMRLSQDSRVVVVLRHFLDYTYEEMGEVLDIPTKTVKSRLYTARRQLGALLFDRSPA